MMGGFTLPPKTIREMITGSIDVIVQASRLRDGSRKVTHITEVVGMEGEVVTLQNLFVYEITGEDAQGKIVGRHRSTGIARPRFWERAEYSARPRAWRRPWPRPRCTIPAAAPWVTLVDSDNLMLIGLLVLAAVSVGAIVYLLVIAVLLGRAAHRQAPAGPDRHQVAPPRQPRPRPTSPRTESARSPTP